MAPPMPAHPNRRIIIIDDVASIHDDFDKILSSQEDSEDSRILDELDSLLFDEDDSEDNEQLEFEIDHAFQGEEGALKIEKALKLGKPYALAFVDMRMPPGWDGLQTIEEIWKRAPKTQIVICSAYSDYTWEEIINRLGTSEHLLILKKPFDKAEVTQMATALTDKWNAQEQSESLMTTLEEKVEERTAELHQLNDRLTRLNGDLEEAVKEAECAARAKGRFLATMSHEIRTTLNGIMGAAYMLVKSDLQAKDMEFAEIIQSSGESLMTIINDILDYSKYESGQLELERTSFSIADLAGECVDLLSPLIEKNEVKFTFTKDYDLPKRLLGDSGRIRQVILNLLNNAIKFSKRESVELRLESGASKDETVEITLSVIDTGIGMSAETVESLFTAFTQADSSTTREYGGTGLGLAICQLLADAMDGNIEVRSEKGMGSTFAFRFPLPIDTEHGSEKSNTRSQDQDSVSGEGDLSGKRVMVVDDNHVNLKLAQHFLGTLGISVTAVSSGAECIKRFKEESFDLVLMDLQMPIIDGIEATRRIRECESSETWKRPRTPVVALTANAFLEDRDRCNDGDMDDFLSKPLRMQELKSTLYKWLEPVSN